MDKIAVLIPCYNEEQTIAKVVKDFREALPEAVIYVYNNNSTDRTAEEAAKAGAVVREEYQQGKGCVIRRMFREVDAACYLMVDGDDTYPAESADALVSKVLTRHADMVVGDRLSGTYYTENKRPFHNFGNSLMKRVINRLFDCEISDIMTGYRAFSYNFVKTFPILSSGFEIETEMTIHAVDKKMQVESEDIVYRDRPAGSTSKLNTISDGLKVIRTAFRLYREYKPLCFFGAVSLLLALLSILFVIPVFQSFFATGMVERFPTLIVCGFTMLAAIVSLFTGLILDSINRKDAQEFELDLIRTELKRREMEGRED